MEATLDVVKRGSRGKNEARRLRASGRVPAVVYGAVKDGTRPVGVPVAVDPKEVLRILRSDSGVNTLITLKLDGGESRVMVKEFQLDPVTHQLLHADFYQLAMDRAIVVTVPIAVRGEAKGVKQQGGILDFVTREVEVECLPADIPGHIDVDVSELMLHESVRARDLPTSPTWKLVTEPDTMLVHVVMPKAEEAPAAAEGEAAAAAAAPAAPAEPEVIKKGKVEKEGDEAPKK
jgi:large subunit ribosomal protein L25